MWVEPCKAKSILSKAFAIAERPVHTKGNDDKCDGKDDV